MTSEPAKKPKLMTYEEESIEMLIKKIKSSTTNLIPVISDDLYKEIPLVKVFVATIKNPKDISKTILMLNQKLPLNELQHLKRVAKKEIILCPVHVLKDESIEKYIKENFTELEGTFESFKELEVPSLPPKVKRQFEICNKTWPCNFHPNKYHEKLVSSDYFSEKELKNHRQYMEVVCATASYYLKQNKEEKNEIVRNAAVVVDPSINSVVAISFENKSNHPIHHAAMLAIDNVAKTQKGGAWVVNREKMEAIDTTLRGIDEDLSCYLTDAFPGVKFGGKTFKSQKDESSDVKSGEIGPYLCTNYDVYLLKEPCLMCSMALVHARAKRVYFCMENSEFGGLKSKAKLQTISSLNHHFEVFTGFV